MTQLVTRIDDALAARLDELVAAGAAESRSDAVRQGLRVIIDRYRRHQIAEAIVGGYTVQPQNDEEVGWADEATIRMIGDEPW